MLVTPAEAMRRGLYIARFNPLRLLGCMFWFDLTRLTGYADGASVPTLSDLSGNGNHAAQATSSKQGVLKLAQNNGLSALRLDGVDDFYSIPDVAALQLTRFTLVAVFKRNAQRGLIYNKKRFTAGNNNAGYNFDLAATGEVSIGIYNNADNSVIGSAALPTTPTIWIGSLDASLNAKSFVAGTADISAVAASAPATTTFPGLIGCRDDLNLGLPDSFFSGDLYELGLYNRDLSLNERNKTFRMLSKKHAVAVTL